MVIHIKNTLRETIQMYTGRYFLFNVIITYIYFYCMNSEFFLIFMVFMIRFWLVLTLILLHEYWNIHYCMNIVNLFASYLQCMLFTVNLFWYSEIFLICMTQCDKASHEKEIFKSTWGYIQEKKRIVAVTVTKPFHNLIIQSVADITLEIVIW